MFRWQQNPDDAFDISPRAPDPWRKFDPWYEHGQIPVPGFFGMQAQTVAGIMEAMKLTGPEGHGGKINLSYLVGGKRKREVPEGHWLAGYQAQSSRVGLAEARRRVFVPAYCWVLRNKLADELAMLKIRARSTEVPLYDGRDNADLEDERPLSYAALVCAYVRGDVDGFCRGEYVVMQ